MVDNNEAFRKRITTELRNAREIQERACPLNSSLPEYLDYWVVSRPAEELGGDCCDFFSLPNGKLGIAIADACGKGVPAALLMARLQGALCARASAESPAAVVRSLNSLLHRCSTPDRFASLFYAVYDPMTLLLTYVNAGHNSPLVIRGESVTRLEEGGPVIGLLPQATFLEATIKLRTGDVIILYTDGIPEAMNPECEHWGEALLVETARRCRGLKLREAAARMIAAADRFAAGAPQHDDMTLAVIRITGGHLMGMAPALCQRDEQGQFGNNCVTLTQ